MLRGFWCGLDGAVRNDAVSAEVASLPSVDALPIRQFYGWPGKRNYGCLVVEHQSPAWAFESLLEREYLLAADATVDIVAVAAQPLTLLWPHGAPGERNHVPDFFVRLASGDGRLVDVRAGVLLPRAAVPEVGRRC
jgi:hypothetical protein